MKGTILGVPIIRAIVFWGSILGSPLFWEITHLPVQPRVQLGRREDLLLLSRHLCCQVSRVGVVHGDLGAGRAALHDELSQHRAGLADLLSHQPCVNSIDSRNALRLQPLPQSSNAAVVRWLVGVVGDHNSFQVNLVTLKPLGKSKLIFLIRWHPIVSDQRIGDDQDLPGI